MLTNLDNWVYLFVVWLISILFKKEEVFHIYLQEFSEDSLTAYWDVI